jgi:hypothetical protein
MGERTLFLMENWKKYEMAGKSFDLSSEMSKLTLDNIGIAAFGGHFNAIESDANNIHSAVATTLR